MVCYFGRLSRSATTFRCVGLLSRFATSDGYFRGKRRNQYCTAGADRYDPQHHRHVPPPFAPVEILDLIQRRFVWREMDRTLGESEP
jgi:hypothetical protein